MLMSSDDQQVFENDLDWYLSAQGTPRSSALQSRLSHYLAARSESDLLDLHLNWEDDGYNISNLIYVLLPY